MGLVRPQPVQVKVAEIGRIFKGGKKGTSTRGYAGGDDLDHFRFEPNERLKDFPIDGGTNAYDLLRDRWNELGDKPRTIPIRFIHSDPGLIFTASNEVWSNKGGNERCIRRCNGETVLLHYQDRPNARGQSQPVLSRQPMPCAAQPGENKCPMDCKPTGRLAFVIPQLGYPGQILLTTHSIHDITELQGNLAAYANFDLSKIPFLLCRSLKSCPHHKPDGTVMPQKKWLLHLEIDPEFGNSILNSQAIQYRAMLEGIPQRQLSSGYDPALQGLMLEPGTDEEVIDVEAGDDEGGETEPQEDAIRILASFDHYLSQATTEDQLTRLDAWIKHEQNWEPLSLQQRTQISQQLQAKLAQIAQSGI